jgi:hypothetical protein
MKYNVNLIDYLERRTALNSKNISNMISKYENNIKKIYVQYKNNQNQHSYYTLINNQLYFYILSYIVLVLYKTMYSNSNTTIKLTSIMITNQSVSCIFTDTQLNIDYNAYIYIGPTSNEYGIPFGPGKLYIYVNPNINKKQNIQYEQNNKNINEITSQINQNLKSVNTNFQNELTTLISNPTY